MCVGRGGVYLCTCIDMGEGNFLEKHTENEQQLPVENEENTNSVS